MEETSEEVARLGRLRRGRWRITGVVGVLVVLSIGAWWIVSHHRAPTPAFPTESYTAGHRSLLSSYGDGYPIKARLSGSGGGLHQPSSLPAGSFLSFSGNAVDPRVFAEAKIERETEELGTPEAWAASAVRSLLRGQTDRAIGVLEALHLQRPDDLRMVNDLSAAYLVRGGTDKSPLDVLEALELAEALSQREPVLPEPQFNLALGLDLLGLHKPAAEAWSAYLEIDPSTSKWAETARERREILLRPEAYEFWHDVQGELAHHAIQRRQYLRELILDFPRETLDEAERWLFLDWAEATLAGDLPTRERVLRQVQGVASSLPSDRGGALLESALANVRAEQEKEGGRRLAEAYRALAQGIAFIERFEVQEAAEPIDHAVGALVDLDSPYTPRALYLSAICRFQETGYDEAERLLEDASTLASAVSDPVTLTNSLQLHAQIDAIRGRPGKSLKRQGAAMELFRRYGWKGMLASLKSLHAEILGVIGDDERAWHYRQSALTSMGDVTSPRLRLRIWSELTLAAAERSPRLGLYFAHELVEAATEFDLPLAYAIAHETRASVLARLEDFDGALADLDVAQAWSDQLEDRAVRDMLRGNQLRLRGELLASREPATALPMLNEATSLYRRTGYEGELPPILWARARSLRGASDLERAEADLTEAIALLEARRREVVDPMAWDGFVTDARMVYDEMIDLQERTGRSHRALGYSVRSRWELGDSAPSGSGGNAIGSRFAGQDAAVLVFHSLSDRLLVWVLRGRGSELADVPVHRSELKRRVTALHRTLHTGGQVEGAMEAVHELLIAPVAHLLRGVKRLVVVPDGALDRVPFGVLRDPETDRYLIQDRSVSGATSLFAAQESLALPVGPALGPSTAVLAVGDPLADPVLELERLPRSELEAQVVAEKYPRTTLLLGEGATESAFIEAARRAEILHYAGHALLNDSRILFSSLALVPDQEEDGLLFAHEVLQVPLSGTKLAVISACGQGAKGSGSTGLTGAFLSAGVSKVIASFWDVADQPTAILFESFYDALRGGATPEEALRTSQLELLSSTDPQLSNPAVWGAFQLTMGTLTEGD